MVEKIKIIKYRKWMVGRQSSKLKNPLCFKIRNGKENANISQGWLPLFLKVFCHVADES